MRCVEADLRFTTMGNLLSRRARAQSSALQSGQRVFRRKRAHGFEEAARCLRLKLV